MIVRLLLSVFVLVAFAAPSTAATKGQVLVVVSSEREIILKDGKTYPTGFYLNELAVPVQKLVAAGYTPVFANPKGNVPVMDEGSNDKAYFGGDDAKRAATLSFVQNLPGFKQPKTLAAVLTEGVDGYAGIFVPGGHAPMQDLPMSTELGEILRRFHKAGKPTALICHGPVALIAALPNAAAFQDAIVKGDAKTAATLSEGWVYARYRMTAFSTPEERIAEASKLGGQVRFYPAEILAEAGGLVQVAGKWRSHVVRDRELITGQQPFSDDAFSEAFLAALDEKQF